MNESEAKRAKETSRSDVLDVEVAGRWLAGMRRSQVEGMLGLGMVSSESKARQNSQTPPTTLATIGVHPAPSSQRDALASVDQMIAEAEAASSAISDMADAANVMLNGVGGFPATKPFGQTAKAFKAMTAMKAASAGFAAAGAVLGVAQAVMSFFGKSPEDIMIDMLVQLQKSVDTLRAENSLQFEKLYGSIKLAAVKTVLFNAFSDIDTVEGLARPYQDLLDQELRGETKPDEKLLEAAEEQLANADCNVLFQAVTSLRNAAAGRVGDVTENVFEAWYNSKETYGSLDRMLRVGSSMISYANQAMMLDAMVRTARAAQYGDTGQALEDKIAVIHSLVHMTYSPLITTIHDQFEEWVKKAQDELGQNINRALNDSMTECRYADDNSRSIFVRQFLDTLFPWIAFTVIVSHDEGAIEVLGPNPTKAGGRFAVGDFSHCLVLWYEPDGEHEASAVAPPNGVGLWANWAVACGRSGKLIVPSEFATLATQVPEMVSWTRAKPLEKLGLAVPSFAAFFQHLYRGVQGHPSLTGIICMGTKSLFVSTTIPGGWFEGGNYKYKAFRVLVTGSMHQ